MNFLCFETDILKVSKVIFTEVCTIMQDCAIFDARILDAEEDEL